MSYRSLKFNVGFDCAVSILSAEGYYLPQFIDPNWKEDEYAIFRRLGSRGAIGYLCKNQKKKGSRCYVEFEDECSSIERNIIKKSLEKGWSYWEELNNKVLKKRKIKDLEIAPKRQKG